MFEIVNNGTSLNNNFRNDHFFDTTQTLNIIDDYNILDIKDDAIAFYVKSFNGLGVKNINIYFQVKFVTQQRRNEIEEICSEHEGINQNKLLAFCLFIKKGLYPNRKRIKEIVFTNANLKKVNRALVFIKEMKSVGITITLYPYYSFNINPSFHGRYWITEEKGYIVDGSLQTYSTGMIFAQLMDDVNFKIIKEQIFDEQIKNNARVFESLSRDDIETLKDCFLFYKK